MALTLTFFCLKRESINSFAFSTLSGGKDIAIVIESKSMPCNSTEVHGHTFFLAFTGIPMDSDRAKNDLMPKNDSLVLGWPKNSHQECEIDV